MKKFFSFVAMMLLVSTTIIAQNEKQNVAIEEFTYDSSTDANRVTNLRNNIISGITATTRVNVIDITNLTSLPTDKQERLIALGDLVDVILTCHINSITTSTKDNKWTCKSNYTITLTDAHGGAVISTTPFEDSWLSGSTESEAITECMNYATKNMKKFVDNNFKIEAIVKQFDQVDENKKGVKTVKTAYISVGSNAGVTVGQMFDIMAESEVASEKVWKKIGDAKAQEIISASMTLVKITKGGREMQEAYEKNYKLKVQSRAKKDPLGGLLDL